MNKIKQILKKIDLSWFGAVAVIACICSLEFGFGATGSWTLLTVIKEIFKMVVAVAFVVLCIAFIILLCIMVYTKNWGMVYWVGGIGVAAYLVGNVEAYMSDMGVTGALF